MHAVAIADGKKVQCWFLHQIWSQNKVILVLLRYHNLDSFFLALSCGKSKFLNDVTMALVLIVGRLRN